MILLEEQAEVGLVQYNGLYEITADMGTLICPNSMSAALSRISVNGRIECYPDGSAVMGKEWIIDRFFPMRAKEGGSLCNECRAVCVIGGMCQACANTFCFFDYICKIM